MPELRKQIVWAVVVAALLITAIDLYNTYAPHRCSDDTHITCDGTCVCDGFECK